MTKISFLNEKYINHDQAFVHIEDRGFQFADGVYEVVLFHKNNLIDIDRHLNRLFRSLKEIGITISQSKEDIQNIFLNLCQKNNTQNCSIYLQITRGSAASRIQTFPKDIDPTIIANISPLKNNPQHHLQNGISAITHPDLRWQRCDVKSIGLLASTMAKQKAQEKGYDEVILIKDNYITEASFANVFIIDADNNLVTRNADHNILKGITRDRIIELALENDIKVIERKFSLQELLLAKEVFITSSTLLVRPVIKVDDKLINQGEIGEMTKKINFYYNQFINK